MSSKLIAYALDATSFIIEKTSHRDNIRQVILFGSVAREEAGKESDIDLFIDVLQEGKEMEEEIHQLLNRFYQSQKYLHYWKPLGVTQEIKPMIGKLNSWEELLPSVIANGIVLYGKFTAEVKGRHQAIFVWENITPNAKRVAFNKKLFGYRQRKKLYPGLLQQQQGQRLGKGCLVVDLATSLPIHKLFKSFKITVKIKKVISY